MLESLDHIPDDADELKSLVGSMFDELKNWDTRIASLGDELKSRDIQLENRDIAIKNQEIRIEKLLHELSGHRRSRFGSTLTRR